MSNNTNNNETSKYHFVTNAINTYFNKEDSNKDKYIVCTCAKNENDYIVEFVKHYLDLDFDKIIICDNNDDNSIEIVLKEFIDNGQVEIFNCRGFDSFQVQFYTMFSNYGNYKWCAYYDADEFLELGIYTSIKDFLNTIPEDIDGVCFNWLLFGTNGEYHQKHGRIQDRFKTPIRNSGTFKENVFVKSILRGGENRFENNWFNGSHIPKCSNNIKFSIGGYYDVDYTMHTYSPPRYKIGYLKHYYTKSFDEWIKKASRGWPDGTPNLAAANFSICEDSVQDYDRLFKTGFFISSDHLENIAKNWIDIFDTYDVINVRCESKQMYSFYTQLTAMLINVTNKTFIISDDIDEGMYATLLEYALAHGNRLVYAVSDADKWKAFLKYSQKTCYWILNIG